MSLPDNRYVGMPPLQQTLFAKLDGSMLSAGIVYFYEDEDRNTLKAIYSVTQSPGGAYTYTQLPNPLTLSSTGTFVNPSTGYPVQVYLFPYDGTPASSNGDVVLYYIKWTDSNGLFQGEQVGYPYGVEDTSSSQSLQGAQNLLTNSQFALTLFTVDPSTSKCAYAVTGTLTVTPIAQGWDLVTTGSGTVTVFQKQVLDTTAVTTPTYALDIQTTGTLSYIAIRQRLSNSPRLIANGYVSGGFAVNSQDGLTHDLILKYTPSNGSPHTILNYTTNVTTIFDYAFGNTQINGTINPDSASGYVDIILEIPTTCHIQLTSFQLVQVTDAATFPTYLQQSTLEQINEVYWYDRNNLFFKPAQSTLVGWDFKTNPAQFAASTVTVTTTPAYCWDQTIMARVGGADVSVTRRTETGGMSCATTTANTAFYTMQYISGFQARSILTNPLSVNIAAWTTTAVASAPIVRVYLYRAGSTGAIPTLPTPLGALGTDGTFLLSTANWTEIPRGGQNTAIGTILGASAYTQLNGSLYDVGFSGWQITDSTQIGDTNKYAIVVTYLCPSANTTVIIDSQSLVLGNIPTRPAYKPESTVYDECRYYYEKTWDKSTAIGTATEVGCLFIPALISPDATTTTNAVRNLIGRSWGFRYRPKRVNPTIVFYSPASGASANVFGRILNGGSVSTSGTFSSAIFTETGKGLDGVYYRVGDVTSQLNSLAFVGNFAEAYIVAQATIDSRLGVV